MSTADALGQLEDQQGLLTAALRGMLEGKWCGAGSAAAFLQALDPSLPDLDCNPPVLLSDRPAAPEPALAAFDPETQMPRQRTSWTCSAASLSWVLRALRSAPDVDESQAVDLHPDPARARRAWAEVESRVAELRPGVHDLRDVARLHERRSVVPLGGRARRLGCRAEHRQLGAWLQGRFFDAVARAVQQPGAVFVYLDHEVRASSGAARGSYEIS
jgi:hypothetical protein